MLVVLLAAGTAGASPAHISLGERVHGFDVPEPKVWPESTNVGARNGEYWINDGWSVTHTTYGDVRILGKLRVPDETSTGTVGWYFRASAGKAYFAGVSAAGVVQIERLDGAKWTILRKGKHAKDVTTGIALEVLAVGTRIELRIDGAVALAVDDGTYASGAVGVFTAGVESFFDDVRIEPLLSLEGMSADLADSWRKAADRDPSAAAEIVSAVLPAEPAPFRGEAVVAFDPDTDEAQYRRLVFREDRLVAAIETRAAGATLAAATLALRDKLDAEWKPIVGGDVRSAAARIDALVIGWGMNDRFAAFFNWSWTDNRFVVGFTYYAKADWDGKALRTGARPVYGYSEAAEAPSLWLATAMLERQYRLTAGGRIATGESVRDVVDALPRDDDPLTAARVAFENGRGDRGAALLREYLRGAANDDERVGEAYTLAVRHRHGGEVPDGAAGLLLDAKRALAAGDSDTALERYRQAAVLAPWWPEPHYGRALILERRAYAFGGAAGGADTVAFDRNVIAGFLESSSAAYRLAHDAMASDDGRRSRLARRMRDIDKTIADLRAPEQIRAAPSWPYGRPRISIAVVGLALQLGLSGNDALGEAIGDADDTGHFPLTMNFAVMSRVRPKWVGALQLTVIDFVDADPEGNGALIDVGGLHLTAMAQREYVQDVSGGNYFAMFVDGGVGWTWARGDYYPTSDRDTAQPLRGGGPHVAVGTGIGYYSGNLLAFEFYSRLFLDLAIALNDEDGDRAVVGGEELEVSFARWEILGGRLMISF